MTNLSVRYKNADILLMCLAYSRLIETDEDAELDCVDLVAETLVHGLYGITPNPDKMATVQGRILANKMM